MTVVSRRMLILIIFQLFSVHPDIAKAKLNPADAGIACTVSSCMGWCGCKGTHDFMKIRQLKDQCRHHFNTSYTTATRCTAHNTQLCLCKQDNDNCKRCQRDSVNDMMCFRQIPPSNEVSTCKDGRCYQMSVACGLGTGCLGCMRPSTTSRPSTRGPAFPNPPRKPQSPAPQQPANKAGIEVGAGAGTAAGVGAGGVSNPSSTPASRPGDGANGDGGLNPDQGSNNHVLPHADDVENTTAKIVAIVACTVMVLISCTVLAIVICKFKRHRDGRDHNQNGDLKEDGCHGYATIGEPKTKLKGSCTSRDKIFANQLYDGAFIIDKNSTGPPIPLSERPSASRQASGEAYLVTNTISQTSEGTKVYDTPSAKRRSQIASGLISLKGRVFDYMSLKKVKKPLPPWKGPHGERYNLEGYIELNKAMPNKSNNASSTSSLKRCTSECMLASNLGIPEMESRSRSLPTTLTRSNSESEYPNNSNVARDAPPEKESVYYYSLDVDQTASDVNDIPEDVESSYYYKLQPDGEAVVTLIGNPCCVKLSEMPSEENDVDGAGIPL